MALHVPLRETTQFFRAISRVPRACRQSRCFSSNCNKHESTDL